jgi:orotate phosphoribosyltransferase
MTQKKFLASEEGFIADSAPEKIYSIAAKNGVRDFVVPGNKVEFVQKYRELLENLLGQGNFVLYAPGFIAQGGDISETGKVAGENWHPIVGSAIYKAENKREAAKKITEKIEKARIERRSLEIFAQNKAIITGSHIVYTSKRHGSDYVNKDAIYPNTKATDELCGFIAEHFKDAKVEVVVAPAVGGVILSHETAGRLTELTGQEVLGIADKEGDTLVFKRGYGEFIKGKRVLVVDDVLTTGGSVAKLVELVRSLDGEVVAVAVLCNRGGVKVEDIGNVPELFALVNVQMADFEESECPFCKASIPINIEVGKGKAYLAEKAKVA